MKVERLFHIIVIFLVSHVFLSFEGDPALHHVVPCQSGSIESHKVKNIKKSEKTQRKRKRDTLITEESMTTNPIISIAYYDQPHTIILSNIFSEGCNKGGKCQIAVWI